jgi:DNA ligase (NAD+)
MAGWYLAVTLVAAEAPDHPTASDTFGRPTPVEAAQRIAVLRAEIARHDALYFQKAAPEIGDFAYDQLKRELAGLEQAHPDPTRAPSSADGLGDDRSGLFPTYRHREPMLSLDKTYAEADVRAFHARLVRRLHREDLMFVIEPKVDGLAVSVTYEKGKLVRAVTRGNGIEGDDITANARLLPHLPRQLRETDASHPWPESIELRGEIYVPFAEFRRVNDEREAVGESPFANPRNLAAGTVRQTDPEEIGRRGLDVIFYGFAACEPAAAAPGTQRELHERMRAWGLPVFERYWTARDADEMWTAVQAVGHERAHLGFPTDGAVVKLDPVPLQRELGATATAPRWAVAYKFAPDRVETQLLAITVQVGRTGLLTPVAELAPVTLAGTTVARATLHNAGEIARNDFRVGDFVYVEKAGEIIPAVVGVNLERRTSAIQSYVFPAACPVCGAAIAPMGEEAARRCPNAACPAQVRGRVEHFASKAGVEIAGLGPTLIAALVEKGRVRTIADLYRLHADDLVVSGRKADKSADRLIVAIAASKRAELWRFIHGLGIPRVGEAAAKVLARRFGSLAALAAAQPGNLVAGRESVIPGLGAATALAVRDYLADPQNRALLAELQAAGVNPVEK